MTGEVPFPSKMLFAVSDDAPVPPAFTLRVVVADGALDPFPYTSPVNWVAVMGEAPCPRRNPLVAKVEAPVPPFPTVSAFTRFRVPIKEDVAFRVLIRTAPPVRMDSPKVVRVPMFVDVALSVAIRPSETRAVSITVVDALMVERRLSAEVRLVFTFRVSIFEDVAFRDPVTRRFESIVDDPETNIPAPDVVGVMAPTKICCHAAPTDAPEASVPQ